MKMTPDEERLRAVTQIIKRTEHNVPSTQKMDVWLACEKKAREIIQLLVPACVILAALSCGKRPSDQPERYDSPPAGDTAYDSAHWQGPPDGPRALVSPRMVAPPTGGDSLQELPDSTLKDSVKTRVGEGQDSVLVGDTLTIVRWVADSEKVERYTRRSIARRLNVTLLGASTSIVGIPMGPYGFDITTGQTLGAFNLDIGSTAPGAIVSLINASRNRGIKLILAMTGGSHDNYMSTLNGVLQFDFTKWKSRMDKFNTATIKNAVAAGVADGTVIGANMMDEPQAHADVQSGGNTWGPEGTMTKVRVDQLCGYAKSIFPTLPVGINARWAVFEPTKTYQTCEFFIDQYSYRLGELGAYRQGVLTYLQKQVSAGHSMRLVAAMNVINGGTQDKTGAWDCPQSHRGYTAPNCWMTPEQVKAAGASYGVLGCGFVMWQWDDAFMGRATNQQAFQSVAGLLKLKPKVPCR